MGLDIRNIKTTLRMETLSCKTPEMGEKELWVYLLAYNLIRLLMAQSALVSDVLPRTLSFKHTVQLWLAWSGMSAREDDGNNFEKLLALVAERSVSNRPGRIESSAIKRRPKPYPLLTITRNLARENVTKYGTHELMAHSNYLVIYSIEDEAVEILRVKHASQ